MGAGKSTLGKALAEKLTVPFMDSDAMIEEHEQESIEHIFRTHGEAYFRKLEQEYITQLPKEGAFVLAAGGGLPCYNNLMEQLNQLGTTYYLKHTPQTLIQRLKADHLKRPLLRGLNDTELSAFVTQQLNQREQYYLKAHHSLPEELQNSTYLSQLTR